MHALRLETEDTMIERIEVRIRRAGDPPSSFTDPDLSEWREAMDRYKAALSQGITVAASREETTADPVLQLEWSGTVSTERFSLDEATEIATAHRGAGHSDWRLPTIKELLSIVDYTRHEPAIDSAIFPNTKSSYYWSSSPFSANPDYAWIVNFDSGEASWVPRSNCAAFVRAVRSSSAAQ